MRRDLLATLRRISGDELDNDVKRRNMLRAMVALANQLTDMGDDTAAMPLLDEALPGCLRVCGEDAHETVRYFAIVRPYSGTYWTKVQLSRKLYKGSVWHARNGFV